MKRIKIHTWRRVIQTGVAGLFIILPILNQAGFNFIWGNFLNIHIGCLTFSDPLAAFQVILKNHYLPIGLLIGVGMVLAIAFFLGTVFCSWICPFGLLSELINSFSSRVWPKRFRNKRIQTRDFAVKATVFCTGFLVFWSFFNTPILNQVSMPFQYSNIFQYLFMQKDLSPVIWFMGVILLLEFIFQTRLWCRWICPQSVLLSVVKRFNPFGFKIVFKQKRCISNKAPFPCQQACSLNLDPKHMDGWSLAQCTNCGDCVDACEKTGKALVYKFSLGNEM
ncbi:NapH [Desulforapulum autotrophicum HRM2]|uniref:NapH n=1 Tax=Desulforapulum autotrophicum (strain ATCC 43914 / DSM 3382 / VKM B-1955 / HRM2) TaxID=177437 RepID=C0QKJ6_DESAH|nr:NapH [Desulforapulum autotrophicum HRM2]